MTPTVEEMLAVAISHSFREGAVGFIGLASTSVRSILVTEVDVGESTGFALPSASAAPTTEEPPATELSTLRTVVDPAGLLGGAGAAAAQGSGR